MEKQIDNDIDISKNKFEYKLIGPYINTDKYSYIEISITFNNIIVSGLFYIPELKINSNINQLNFNSYDDSDDIQDITPFSMKNGTANKKKMIKKRKKILAIERCNCTPKSMLLFDVQKEVRSFCDFLYLIINKRSIFLLNTSLLFSS